MLMQRAILTAVAELKLVGADTLEACTATVGSVVIPELCETTVRDDSTHSTASLSLVLKNLERIDYAAVSCCINARLAEIRCLSGQESLLQRTAIPRIYITVSLSVGAAANKVSPDNFPFIPSLLNRVLDRDENDGLLGITDVRLGSMEQRVTYLLLRGFEQDGAWLDELLCSSSRKDSTCDPVLDIEEIGTMGALTEDCCATGCEPCVWDAYYRLQRESYNPNPDPNPNSY